MSPVGAAAGPGAPSAPTGLVYVSDDAPGLRRVRRGKGFSYQHPDGRRLTDTAQLERIRRLAIPPAYTDVWICLLPQGHLQATGRDARGRKQFRYHAEWRRARDETKFERMLEFAQALPRLRAQVQRDLAVPVGQRIVRETVVAAVVHLLDTTLVRVGNDEYARSNGSFGLTTLHNRHAFVRGQALRLRFRGKSGVVQEVSLRDRRVARIVARCQALAGQQLFEYLDGAGNAHDIGSADVNEYLRAASGGAFTAKDFRTWHASVLALQWRAELDTIDAPTRARGSSATLVLAEVAARLGNTVAVCRRSYVHPRVLELLCTPAQARGPTEPGPPRKKGLSCAERKLLALLHTSA